MSKVIPLSQGKFAVVDDEDYEELSKFKWCWLKESSGPSPGYAVRSVGRAKTLMHRQLMGFPSGLEVDHIDGNGLNNRRDNLRVCSRLQNARNHSRRIDSSTGVNGVRFNKGRFMAQLGNGKTRVYLGRFKTLKEAEAARLEGERKHYGEFAPSLREKGQP